jgi:hypothetical protein
MRCIDNRLLVELFYRCVQAHDSLDSIFARPDLSGFREYYRPHLPKIRELVKALTINKDTNIVRFTKSDHLNGYILACIKNDLENLIELVDGNTSLNPDYIIGLRVKFHWISQGCLKVLPFTKRRMVTVLKNSRRIEAYLCEFPQALIGIDEYVERVTNCNAVGDITSRLSG